MRIQLMETCEFERDFHSVTLTEIVWNGRWVSLYEDGIRERIPPC